MKFQLKTQKQGKFTSGTPSSTGQPSVTRYMRKISTRKENNNQNIDSGESKDVQKEPNIFREIRTY
jgi:hypothetical protein